MERLKKQSRKINIIIILIIILNKISINMSYAMPYPSKSINKFNDLLEIIPISIVILVFIITSIIFFIKNKEKKSN